MPRLDELEPIAFEAIPAFAREDLVEAFDVFLRSAALVAAGSPAQRPAVAPSAELVAVSRDALAAGRFHSNEAARHFFETRFRPFRAVERGFVTAYYEPVVEASLHPDAEFVAPVLARPEDLVTLNATPLVGAGGELLTSARRRPDGALEPYPDRRAIEEDSAFAQKSAIAYVRDWVELFLIQVQGSARLRLSDGSELPLTYDGRNGHPYTSIGRLLIERGIVLPDAMSLEALKNAIRSMGQEPDEPGRLAMQENRSYVFFRLDRSSERAAGPIGGEGCALTPGRSIAIDRSHWSYGLPVWISADIAWRDENETGFERLMIAQDTGSAILGPARADLFLGCGDRAGELAGRVRHEAEFVVLLPRTGAEYA